jgi:hypothetical protein
MTDPSGGPPKPDLADQFQERMQSFGREAQVAGDRWARDPGFVTAGTWLTRLIGLAFIAVGLWLFGEVSLGLDLPQLNWDLVWPGLLIVLGGLVVLSAAVRRR